MRARGVWSEPGPSRSKLVPIRSHLLPASCSHLSAHSPTAAIHADGSGQVGAALPSHYISDTSCGDTYILSEPGLGSPRCSESCREEGAGQAPESQPCSCWGWGATPTYPWLWVHLHPRAGHTPIPLSPPQLGALLAMASLEQTGGGYVVPWLLGVPLVGTHDMGAPHSCCGTEKGTSVLQPCGCAVVSLGPPEGQPGAAAGCEASGVMGTGGSTSGGTHTWMQMSTSHSSAPGMSAKDTDG